MPPGKGLFILLLAEGFTANDQDAFAGACNHFVEALQRTTPFNTIRFQKNLINVWSGWVASASHGPAIGASSPGSTAFNSTYDPSSSTLKVDSDALSTALSSLVVPGEDGYPDSSPAFWEAAGYEAGLLSLIVAVLTPADSTNGAPASTPVSGEFGGTLALGAFTSFIATSIDTDWWHQVIINQIGSALGLGGEYELADVPATGGAPAVSYLQPAISDQISINATYPNLICFPENGGSELSSPFKPTPTFGWWDLLDGTERTAGLNVTLHPPPANKPDRTPPGSYSTPQLGLFEGGSGYRTQVFRSAQDCLMRRYIGDRSLSFKQGEVPFCPACRYSLTYKLLGFRSTVARYKTLATQILEFDRPSWTIIDPPVQGPISDFSASITTAVAGESPYWSFTYSISSSTAPFGLVIQNLTLQGADTGATGGNVAKQIDFTDLTVNFADGTSESFDVVGALQNPKSVLYAAHNGSCGADNRYLHGLKLTLFGQVDGVDVQVDMSVVLKASFNDIDPTGVPTAVKFYPQLGLTWMTGGPKVVTSIIGSVRIAANGFGGPPTAQLAASAANVLSIFADSNQSAVDGRQRGGPPPFWSTIFDYCRAEISTEIAFDAVRPAGTMPASDTYPWPSGTATAITLAKAARQGAYDNLHIHSDMGQDPVNTLYRLVAAPFCGEDCLHLHWRWGASAARAAPSPRAMASFLGWSGGRANAVAGAPNIPDNQTLRVSVTQLGTERSDGSLVGTGIVAVDPNKTLDPLTKQIWYTATCGNPTSPLPPNQLQVVLEQGVGWAFDYSLNPAALMLWILFQIDEKAVPYALLNYVIPAGFQFQLLYSLIRWFVSGATIVQEVPSGDNSTGSTSGTSMEAL